MRPGKGLLRAHSEQGLGDSEQGLGDGAEAARKVRADVASVLGFKAARGLSGGQITPQSYICERHTGLSRG